MNARGLAAVLALSMCPPRTLPAQEAGASHPSLAVGDVVRFRTTDGDSTRRAVVLEVGTTGLLVEPRGRDSQSLRLSFDDLASLEVARGRRSRAAEGTKWGALVGGVGVLLLVAANGGLVGACEGGCSVYSIAGGVGGALLGAGLGALTGLAFETDRFEPMKVDGLRVSVRPVRRGLGASVTIGF